MVIQSGFRKVKCFIENNCLISDGTSTSIDMLTEEESNTGYRIYAAIMLVPSTILQLFICSMIIKDSMAVGASSSELYKGIAACAFLGLLYAYVWWLILGSFRFRSAWRINYNEILFVEKKDDQNLEQTLASIARSIAHKVTRVQCPYCHKIIHVPSPGEYKCPQCRTSFTFKGDSELLNVKSPVLYDRVIVAGFCVGLPSLFLSGFIHSRLGWYIGNVGIVLLVIALTTNIVQGLRLGVLSLKTNFYRAESPKLFYFGIFCLSGMILCFSLVLSLPYSHQAKYYYNRSLESLGNGNYDKAIEHLNKALEFNPKDAMIFEKRGKAYVLQGKYHEAIADLDKTIELSPNNEGAYFDRGVSYGMLQSYSKALADFSQVIELNPQNAEAYSNRAVIFYKLDKSSKALSDLQVAASLGHKKAQEYLKANGISWDR